MEILKGHESAETAYLVDDYPYGFRLRCKIRYWLEYKAGKGVRFVSQTSNPKKSGLVWNKPKASTYQRFGGCMFLNSDNHVEWVGLNEYGDAEEALIFRQVYGEGVPDAAKPELERWIKAKIEYERLVAEGTPFQIAGREVALEMAAESMGVKLS